MYVDIYVIENLLINYIIISCTSILVKNANSYKRKIIGAVVGTVYSIIYLFPSFKLLYTLPSKVIFIVIIGSISFVYEDKKEFIRILTAFFLVNFFICGSTYFVIYMTGINHLKISFLIIYLIPLLYFEQYLHLSFLFCFSVFCKHELNIYFLYLL